MWIDRCTPQIERRGGGGDREKEGGGVEQHNHTQGRGGARYCSLYDVNRQFRQHSSLTVTHHQPNAEGGGRGRVVGG